MSKIDPESGLTEEEKAVLDPLMQSYDAWLRLEMEHPDDMRYFVDAVHRIQDLLALRVTRRAYPIGWPKKVAKDA